MKRTIAIASLCILHSAFCIPASAAIPTLSGLADAIEEMRSGFASRLADTSNRLAQANERIDSLWDRLDEVSGRQTRQDGTIDALLVLVEGNGGLREQWHGGKIGTYVVTNGVFEHNGQIRQRLISVDLYVDGSAWTNGTSTAVRVVRDPEAYAKRLAEMAAKRERVQAAWEAANLPPDLAELRARQREMERQNEE